MYICIYMYTHGELNMAMEEPPFQVDFRPAINLDCHVWLPENIYQNPTRSMIHFDSLVCFYLLWGFWSNIIYICLYTYIYYILYIYYIYIIFTIYILYVIYIYTLNTYIPQDPSSLLRSRVAQARWKWHLDTMGLHGWKAVIFWDSIGFHRE